jgi:hypothetical protein
MADWSTNKRSGGRITSGLRLNTLVDRTLEFVKGELHKWRDDPTRTSEEAEERLNAQLCKHLNVSSRKHFPMVYFHHEEKQTAERRVDISALPSECGFVGATFHSIYDPVTVFEGKRLPPPKHPRGREREYISGGDLKSGGIQWFKLGLHGARYKTVAIIGYIQEGEAAEWLKRINAWIRELDGMIGTDGETWSASEQLKGFTNNDDTLIADSSSSHRRIGEVVSDNVDIRHLWAQMKKNIRSAPSKPIRSVCGRIPIDKKQNSC